MKRLIPLALACCAAACTAPGPLHARAPALQAGQHPRPPVAPGGYEYQLHLPPGAARADEDGGPHWPLMIFLHGSGERGSDIARVKVHGPPRIAERDPAFPFILVSPVS